jgi:hypothetical protein
MTSSSLLGGTELPAQPPGKDTDALGPSDNSDSGSDAQGAYGEGELASDSDAVGTGERATVGDGLAQPDTDILPDRIDGGESLAQDAPLFDDASDVDNLAADDADPADGLDEADANTPGSR